MDTEVGSHGNGTAEEEDGVQSIKSDHEERVALESLLDGGRDKIEQRQHGEHGQEHVVVDDRWVASVGGGDHVTDKCHDQKSPEELRDIIRTIAMGTRKVRETYLEAAHSQVDCLGNHCEGVWGGFGGCCVGG